MKFICGNNQVTLWNADGQVLAEAAFCDVDADTVNINHVFVDTALRGQGVAGKLLEAAVKHLRRQNKNVVLSCSYAVQWFDRHPECRDVCRKTK